jgi:hypothetical protein
MSCSSAGDREDQSGMGLLSGFAKINDFGVKVLKGGVAPSAAAGDYGGTGESDHRDQSSRSVGEGQKRGEILVAKTAGEQSSGQCVRRWRAIPRREVFHGID